MGVHFDVMGVHFQGMGVHLHPHTYRKLHRCILPLSLCDAGFIVSLSLCDAVQPTTSGNYGNLLLVKSVTPFCSQVYTAGTVWHEI